MTASLLAILFAAAAPDAPACNSLNSAALGGPTPPANLAVLRWYGTTNFELDYGNQVIPGLFLDIGTEPLFMAIRDQLPDTRVRSPLYREPVCLQVGAAK